MSQKGHWHGKQTGLNKRSHWETEEGTKNNASNFIWGIIIFFAALSVLKSCVN